MSSMKIAMILTATSSLATVAVCDDDVTRTAGGIRVKAELSDDAATVRSARIEKADHAEDGWVVSNEETSTVAEVLASEDGQLDFVDCNGNGINDVLDITDGADDVNGNGVLDECEYDYGDLNLDGKIDGSDIFIVLGWFAAPFPLFGDLNRDGKTDSADMGLLLSRWGDTPF